MKNITSLVFLLFISFASCSFTNKKFENPDKDKLLLEIIQYVLANGHYNPVDMNDEFSKSVYKNYIEYLDGQKRYFLQSDIDEFQKYETQLDDDLKNGDLTFFNITYDRLMQRMKEAETLSESILSKPLDLTVDEAINTDYENLPYVKNKKRITRTVDKNY